ncbi:5'-methylthioadenosine phosphorylase [Mycobacterium xenopi 4042]|uniref:5'-methylthioadenosine phosphorylase n=1 Tax=Mycobacterium xenopi 4042 TaxID=1299334 RepID=X8CAE3_MYCXE|nr:5'-methylthioadenosine phosphorylase [Mycobacterium xenopi 4042]
MIGGSGFYTFFGADARTINLDTRTAHPALRSPWAPSAGTRLRFCRDTARATNTRPTPCRIERTCGRCARWGAAGVCAVRGRQPDRRARAGTVVVPDQLLDRTHGRADTYFESGGVHASFADPYCPALRAAVTSIPASSTAAPWWWSKARGFPLGRKADGMPRRDARWST